MVCDAYTCVVVVEASAVCDASSSSSSSSMEHQDFKEVTIGRRAGASSGGMSAKAAKDPKAVAAVRMRCDAMRCDAMAVFSRQTFDDE